MQVITIIHITMVSKRYMTQNGSVHLKAQFELSKLASQAKPLNFEIEIAPKTRYKRDRIWDI